MRRILLLAILLFASCVAIAGGDYVSGYVAEFSGSEGTYVFTFRQSEAKPRAPLIQGCAELKVHVTYQRVPWYSWLPFIRSSHPTREQTIEAGAVLQEASSKKGEVAFGFMGYGLVPSGSPCTFLSKGLLLDNGVVLSFNGPV